MKLILYPLILILSLILVGCEKTIDESELVVRNDIHYHGHSDKPYTGKTVSYEDGRLKSRGYFKNGKKEGIYETYHRNGQLYSNFQFKNGKKDGLQEVFDKNGTHQSVSSWLKDMDPTLKTLESPKCFDMGDEVDTSFCEGEQNSN